MGTSCKINFRVNSKHVVSLHWHYDGFPDGNPKDLKNFLKSKMFVNGLTYSKPEFNGWSDCIAHFKTKSGNLYLAFEEEGEVDYEYEINFIFDLNKIWDIPNRIDCKILNESIEDELYFNEIIQIKGEEK